MRIYFIAIVLFLSGLALGGCSRENAAKRDAAARQAGHDAYKATQDVKGAADRAGQALRETGRNLQQGWNEAQHEDRAKQQH